MRPNCNKESRKQVICFDLNGVYLIFDNFIHRILIVFLPHLGSSQTIWDPTHPISSSVSLFKASVTNNACAGVHFISQCYFTDNYWFSPSQVHILKDKQTKNDFTLELRECILVRNKGKDTLAVFFFPLNFTTSFSFEIKRSFRVSRRLWINIYIVIS